MMPAPPVRLVRQRDTHRLVSSRHLPGADSVLTLIADDEDLQAIFELDAATNDRLQSEHGAQPGIGPEELVAAVPLAAVVNAAFAHPHPLGARFNGPDRGAWYSAFLLETAQAEVAFHKRIELAEVGWRDESVTYDDFVSDFNAEFHDLRRTRDFKACLAPDSYRASQALAARLLGDGSMGIVYPSVRHAGGTCVACFRPALVGHVRRARCWRFTWTGGEGPVISRER